MATACIMLKFKEAKKNSIIYAPVDASQANPLVTGVYVMKNALPVVHPQQIKLTVEWEG